MKSILFSFIFFSVIYFTTCLISYAQNDTTKVLIKEVEELQNESQTPKIKITNWKGQLAVENQEFVLE